MRPHNREFVQLSRDEADSIIKKFFNGLISYKNNEIKIWSALSRKYGDSVFNEENYCYSCLLADIRSDTGLICDILDGEIHTTYNKKSNGMYDLTRLKPACYQAIVGVLKDNRAFDILSVVYGLRGEPCLSMQVLADKFDFKSVNTFYVYLRRLLNDLRLFFSSYFLKSVMVFPTKCGFISELEKESVDEEESILCLDIPIRLARLLARRGILTVEKLAKAYIAGVIQQISGIGEQNYGELKLKLLNKGLLKSEIVNNDIDFSGGLHYVFDEYLKKSNL